MIFHITPGKKNKQNSTLHVYSLLLKCLICRWTLSVCLRLKLAEPDPAVRLQLLLSCLFFLFFFLAVSVLSSKCVLVCLFVYILTPVL